MCCKYTTLVRRAKLRRVVVGADGTRADGLVRHTTMHYTIKVRFIRPKSIVTLMSQIRISTGMEEA